MPGAKHWVLRPFIQAATVLLSRLFRESNTAVRAGPCQVEELL